MYHVFTGVNKRNVVNPSDIFTRVLEDKTNASVVNRGFMARNNTIYTYTQSKKGFEYFYCKRLVQSDGIHTEPLNVVICPYKDFNMYSFDSDSVLGLSSPAYIKKYDIVFKTVWDLYEYERCLFHNKNVGDEFSTDYTWWDVKDKIMLEILLLLWEKCDLVKEIVDCKNNFVYCVKNDNYWGCGFDQRLVHITDPKKQPGQNKLGQLWSSVKVIINEKFE